MTGCQVVDAGHDDRVQDDDLTQKDDFLFGKRATEELPMIALSIREIFVYDSGLLCRLIGRHWNEATTDARLLFISHEGRGSSC